LALFVAPLQVTVTLLTGEAGVQAASAGPVAASEAISGASAVACRSIKWRTANNLIFISRFAGFRADRSRIDRARNLRPRNLRDGCSLPFYSGWWGILATPRDHALRDRNPTKKFGPIFRPGQSRYSIQSRRLT
jgi:hypothetical protein